MPDDGNLDPSCSRLHHDEYGTNGGPPRAPPVAQLSIKRRGEGGVREELEHSVAAQTYIH